MTMQQKRKKLVDSDDAQEHGLKENNDLLGLDLQTVMELNIAYLANLLNIEDAEGQRKTNLVQLIFEYSIIGLCLLLFHFMNS